MAQSRLGARPLPGGDDAWDDVEGPGTIDVAALAVDGEADAHFEDGGFGRLLTGADLIAAEFLQVADHALRQGARPSRCIDHLVIKTVSAVMGPVYAHGFIAWHCIFSCYESSLRAKAAPGCWLFGKSC